MAAGLHISISAEPIANIGGLVVTNSIFTSLIVSTIIICLALIVKLKSKETSRPKGLQNVFEWIIESLEGLVTSVTNNRKKTKDFFPFIATFFLFIAFNNLFGLLPGMGTIGFIETPEGIRHAQLAPSQQNLETAKAQAAEINHNDSNNNAGEETHVTVDGEIVKEVNRHAENALEHNKENADHGAKFVPYFRAGTADLNTTLALGIISIVLTQYFGLKHLGLSYLKKYFNFSNPIMFFVGILELISEFAKIISFAFRLFGNVFAGEVLLAVISFLVGIILPMPFYGLEIFVGFIQALVFAMLSLVFFNMATQSHDNH
ncbi:MAG: F0F1 ATP synthase subunit A [Patescibacteria group bacterium]